MRHTKLLLSTSLLVWAPAAAQAANPVPLEEVLHQVWSSSPQLEGQETQASLAGGDRWRRFVFNEPVFQFTNSDDRTADSYGLSLTTSFPKTLAFARLDAARARAQNAEYHAKKYDLARTVTQSFLDCAGAQAGFELQKVTSADLETVFQTLKSLYETGHSTQAEKIGSELQARQARLDLVTAEDKLEVLCKKFEQLLTGTGYPGPTPSAAQIVLPDDLSPALVSELGPVTSDQSRADSAIDTAGATAATAWWSQLPDVTFNAYRNHYLFLPGSPNGQEWTTTFGVSLTVPILFPFHETVEAIRTRSQARIDLNVAELQKISADSDRIDGAREYRRSRARLRELRAQDLALAEALVDSTYSAYRAGKLGYAELVLSRKTLTELRSQEIQLRVSIVNSHLRCLNQCGNSE